ncbi:hypothetical protein HDV06_000639 [Boothiomyces sp. JEL0866]|nr:hypothetical protein HDV06_000639 [Boothiomyces sp. JEL0866]
MRQVENRRPLNPKFKSQAVEDYLRKVKPDLEPLLYSVFYNCLPNTLDTTVEHYEKGQNAFIITGDIPAMWLRDSTNQMLPYLPFLSVDSELRDLYKGVIRQQAEFILEYPYGNAFRYKIDGPANPWAKTDTVTPKPTGRVFEAKWELDSLCSFLQLVNSYFRIFSDDDLFTKHALVDTFKVIFKVFQEQQHMGSYEFTRATTRASETLLLDGKGTPSKYTGMIRSAFRPSDDATIFPFNIPSNAMAVVELRNLLAYLSKFELSDLLNTAENLAIQIDSGIQSYGVVRQKEIGDVFAYEVDGFGSALLMDDANLPSLLSLPLTGYIDRNNPIYQRTRSFVLSENNPYYFSGNYQGVGSPHQGLNYIWPLSLIVQFRTSVDANEKDELLKTILDSSDGLIHESFSMNNADDFTRPWFAWANSLFAQMVMEQFL